jgi:hypothetical protein
MPRRDRNARAGVGDERAARPGGASGVSPAPRPLPTLPTAHVAPAHRNWGDLSYRLQVELERRRRTR